MSITGQETSAYKRQAVVFINPTTKAYSVQDAREIYDAGYLHTDFIEFMREMSAGWPMLKLTVQLIDGDAHAELESRS